jgi:hypothetical protein
VAADAAVGDVAAVLAGDALGDRLRRRQRVVDLLARVADDAGRVERLDHHRQAHFGRLAARRRQLAGVGDDRSDVAVDEPVVFLARHHHHRPPVGLDAVADRAHPVDVLVACDRGLWRRADVGRADEHAAVVDDDVALPRGAVAVAAAARREEIAAALDARGIALHRDRRDGDVDAALELAITELGERQERGACACDHHRQRDGTAADPLVHLDLPLVRGCCPQRRPSCGSMPAAAASLAQPASSRCGRTTAIIPSRASGGICALAPR